jgi:hypothetical protein
MFCLTTSTTITTGVAIRAGVRAGIHNYVDIVMYVYHNNYVYIVVYTHSCCVYTTTLGIKAFTRLLVRPGAVSPDRALYLPTFSHFVIVNKTSLSLSLSLLTVLQSLLDCQ